MAEFYTYLIASLPMLHPGMKPPFPYERFLEICREFIPERDHQVLRSLPRPETYPGEGRIHPTVRGWTRFDTALRNELARIRATRRHLEPAAHLRPDGYTSPSLAAGAAAAGLQASVLDAEKALDEMRWKALEDLGTGHSFDLAFLVTYAYKLQILERWEKIRTADGRTLLDEALAS